MEKLGAKSANSCFQSRKRLPLRVDRKFATCFRKRLRDSRSWFLAVLLQDPKRTFRLRSSCATRSISMGAGRLAVDSNSRESVASWKNPRSPSVTPLHTLGAPAPRTRVLPVFEAWREVLSPTGTREPRACLGGSLSIRPTRRAETGPRRRSVRSSVSPLRRRETTFRRASGPSQELQDKPPKTKDPEAIPAIRHGSTVRALPECEEWPDSFGAIRLRAVSRPPDSTERCRKGRACCTTRLPNRPTGQWRPAHLPWQTIPSTWAHRRKASKGSDVFVDRLHHVSR